MNDIQNGRSFVGYPISHGQQVRHGGVWYEYEADGDVLRRIELMGPQRGPSSVAKIQAETKQVAAAMEPKKSKYRNVHTVVDGIRFSSRAEARYYEKLKLLRDAGEVLWFIRQPSFDLPGKVRYIADFLVVYENGIEIVDVKGFQTPVFLMKKKQVEEIYGIRITVVK